MLVHSFGPFRLNASERLLEKDGASVIIGGRTLDLLIALIDRAGTVVGVKDLMTLVWPDVIVEEANLRVSISALRKALRDGKGGSRYIVNVAGRGYTFVAPLRKERAERPAGDNNTPIALTSRPLPEMPQFLVGRHAVVKNLAQLLLSQRFVSVVGPGGIGKTTVALAVASALRSEFEEDCVCFVDGGAIADPGDLPTAVASAIGCTAESDPLLGIVAFLTNRRTLLILDSCEHLIGAAASLTNVLFQAKTKVHLLTTSREALRMDCENVHLLQPLHYPLDEAPTALQAMATPAVQLFMERATASGYLDTLSDRDAPIVSNICRRLDGIALAIEMVATRVGVYGIHGTVDLLDNGAELVLQGRRDALPRHQSLEALHDWSYRLLSEYEQTVLARLSVFVGELTLAAAHAVVADAGDDRKALTHAIASLGDKSLIQVSSVGGRATYRLLDTTRSYASHKLAERGEKDEIARRHALYFASVLEQTRIHGSTPDNCNASQVDLSLGNIRRAMAWSFSRAGDPAIGLRLTASAAHVSPGHSLLRECQEWCEQALGSLDESERATPLEKDLQEALSTSMTHLRRNDGKLVYTAQRGPDLA